MKTKSTIDQLLGEELDDQFPTGRDTEVPSRNLRRPPEGGPMPEDATPASIAWTAANDGVESAVECLQAAMEVGTIKQSDLITIGVILAHSIRNGVRIATELANALKANEI